MTETAEILSIDQYIHELNLLQDHVLSLPEEKVMAESFAEEQKKLERLIGLLPRYTSEEQKRAQEVVNLFSAKLSIKLEQLKERLKVMSQDMASQETRMKGIKAYGDRQRLF